MIAVLLTAAICCLLDGDRLPVIKDFALQDTTGKKHTSADWRQKKAVVLFFLGTECPVSNYYCPEYCRLGKRYGNESIQFYGIHPDPDVTAEGATKHKEEYRLPFPVLLDPNHAVTRQSGVRVIPEAVLLSNEGRVLYRGRIDDRYALDGKKRDEPSTRDLEKAIQAVMDGKEPSVAVTKAFGCPIPPPKKSGE